MRVRRFLLDYRAAFIALAISAIVHAAVFVSIPNHGDSGTGDEAAPGSAYSATLEGDTAPAAAAPKPAPKAAPRHVARAKPVFRPIAVPDEIAPIAADPILPQMDVPVIDPVTPAQAGAQSPPDKLALAQPAVPVPALASPRFNAEALPPRLSIEYKLTSAFADGHAKYSWSRDGDTYTVNGEAEAIGFFALFLEGRLLQESSGRVTAEGLRPDRFTERKPGNPIAEGIEFDWKSRKAILDKGDGKPKSQELTDNTVDWLTMIFQMAHAPITGESYDLRVFTQRRFYEFHLIIVGEEEIEIPLGKVRAQHLRHVDPKDGEVIDVWLGIDQHYLPVKLRFPVARNRLTVEQLATSISE